ncbi:EthD domain-containing protein [Xylaria venustula]|nr:EthD domain-containing protein [Xylaria venustula]
MTYSVLLFTYRKPGTTPSQFKSHYEMQHMPLVRSLAGATFPLSHTRRYLHRSEHPDGTTTTTTTTARNRLTPATVLIGSQEDLDYDAFGELTFKNEAAFQSSFARFREPGIQVKLAADEEMFLDRARSSVVTLGDVTVTRK